MEIPWAGGSPMPLTSLTWHGQRRQFSQSQLLLLLWSGSSPQQGRYSDQKEPDCLQRSSNSLYSLSVTNSSIDNDNTTSDSDIILCLGYDEINVPVPAGSNAVKMCLGIGIELISKNTSISL